MAVASNHSLTWDLSPFFPSSASTEVATEVEELLKMASSTVARFEKLVPKEDLNSIDECLDLLNKMDARLRVTGAFLSCTVAVDTSDTHAQQLLSRLGKAYATRSKAHTIFGAWVGSFEENEVIEHSELTKSHAYALHKTHVLSEFQMTLEAESLAEDLNLSGSTAWTRLYGDISSNILVSVEGFGDVSMSKARALAYDDSRGVRQAAYEAELLAWKKNETVIAACINGVKGTSITLSTRRGWNSVLDKSLFGAGVDKEILEAMMGAAKQYFPVLRRYLKSKATALGIEKCGFFDIFAPMEAVSTKEWSYESACIFVENQFDAYSEKMGNLARRSYQERWIDVEPRSGKRDGAFCSGFEKDVSRVMMNYKPSYGSVSTLAHELGHAYHNFCMNGVTPAQQRIPMTLAETASTFCETLCRKQAMATMTDLEKLEVLEATLQGATQITLDITSRFLFESRMIEARGKSDVSASELCQIMEDAQWETYGDGLDRTKLHPYMWAAKPHYYGSDFYNYPYMFGLLFALGLYAQYVAGAPNFKENYDELLRNSGMDTPANLAKKFGIDLRSSDFWIGSMKMIEEDVIKFERIVALKH